MRTPWLILLSLLVAFPLFADIPIAAPALRPATGGQSLPALASNGTDALAAWQDERAMPALPSATPTVPEREIYAARITADGTPSVNIDVTPSVETDVAPAVVWNGDEYIVAHLMAPRFGFDGGLRFTRVKPAESIDNRLIPRAEYAPAPAFGLFDDLSLAWNGEEYLAVMSSQYQAEDENSVWGLLVDRSFHAIGPAFPIALGKVSLASAASDGHDFLVTWVDSYRIAAATVSPAGAVAAQPLLSEAPTGSVSFTSRPSVVWNGQRYLITWTDPVVRARFVGRDGAPSSPVLELFGAGRATALAWNGSEFLVPFVTEGNRSDLYALRVDAAGNVLGEPFAIAASDAPELSPAAVAIGERFVVAWQDNITIRSSVVIGDAPQAQSILSRSLGQQQVARGLFDGTNYVFTWEEEGNVYLSRITPDGHALDGGGLLLGSGAGPIIAFNGSEYAVSFLLRPADQTAVVRVSRDGKLLDAAPLVVPRVTAIASDRRDFLLLSVLNTQPVRIRPTILTAQGELLPQPVIEDLPFDSTNPAVAWTGSHYALVYTQATEPFCYKCNQKFELHTVLLDRTGKPATPIRTILAGSEYPYAYRQSRVASGGGSTLAVFGGPSGTNVVRIDGNGVPTPASNIPSLPSTLNDFIWTGSDFVIATYGGFMRLAPDGSPLVLFVLGPPDAGLATLVAAAPQLTILYDRPAPIDGQGTIRRAFFDVAPEHRRRAR
jgi:hypothetical protein